MAHFALKGACAQVGDDGGAVARILSLLLEIFDKQKLCQLLDGKGAGPTKKDCSEIHRVAAIGHD